MTMILTEAQMAYARQCATQIATGLKLAEVENKAIEISQQQRSVEANYVAAQEAADQASDRAKEVRSKIAERESAILAGITNGASHLVEQATELRGMIKSREETLLSEQKADVETWKQAVKDREDELQKATVEETVPVDPANPDGERKPKHTNQNQRNAAFTAAKKSDDQLASLKESLKNAEAGVKAGVTDDEQINTWRQTLKGIESTKVDLTTASARALALKQHGANDEELTLLRAELANVEAAEKQSAGVARQWKTEYNALTRDYHLTVARLQLKAAIVANLGGFELHPQPAAPAAPVG